LYAPVIVKYRDEKTDRGLELEDWLRHEPGGGADEGGARSS